MIPRLPKRMWPDSGGYGSQLTKRIRASERINRAAAQETYAEIKDAPDNELERIITKKKSECLEASDICARSGDMQKARLWELKSMMIDSSWNRSEIREYFDILERERAEASGSHNKPKAGIIFRFITLCFGLFMLYLLLMLSLLLIEGFTNNNLVVLIFAAITTPVAVNLTIKSFRITFTGR